MGAPQRQVIEVIQNKVKDIDERFDGYREALLAVLDEILKLEQERPHNVVQKVQRRIAALGERLARQQGAES